MDSTQYRDAVVENRRKHDFEVIDEYTKGFDPVWVTHDDDDASVGDVAVFATLVNRPNPGPADITAAADEFREVLVDRVDERRGSTTPLGYVTFAAADPDQSVIDAARSYTVARRRTNVFPIVYDCEAETLHRHEIPRLKGRGIYRRQAEDVERLFEVTE
ncbi:MULTISPECIES: hypothetical protein [Halorubrum]|uniref:Uncharacterized protein n=1 Tax=Halorubrum persicum TaxID=1383844 RepID=A0A2G1WJK6_9EURY|nr:hypothetical protein [Halorubrum persicum]PHQ39125.1 hypothetical protein DJ69_07770 [Halorubrum persicum]